MSSFQWSLLWPPYLKPHSLSLVQPCLISLSTFWYSTFYFLICWLPAFFPLACVMWVYNFLLPFKIIVVKFKWHKSSNFKVYNSEPFNIFTTLYHRYFYLVPKTFSSLSKEAPCPLSSHSSSPYLPQSLETTYLLSVTHPFWLYAIWWGWWKNKWNYAGKISLVK